MPICRDCGLGVPPSYDACPKCGRDLVTVAAPPVEEAAPSPQPAVATKPADPQPSDDYQSFFVRASAAPTPTAPATPVLAPGQTACSVCGRGPAVYLRLRRHMGLIWIIRFARLDAPFCRDHGVAAASEYLRRTLVEGWWGFLSFILNWYAIYVCVQAKRAAAALPAPVGLTDETLAGGLPEDVVGALSESAESRSARRSVLRAVAFAIGLGILGLVVVNMALDSATDSIFHRLGIELSTTTLVYVAVALIVASQLRAGRVHPRASEGSPASSVAIGALIGGGAAFVLAMVFSALSGRLTSDPRLLGVIFEGTPSLVLIIVFITVVAAPIVEEVLFRGLLVESLRSRGRTSAILGGAVAFSLWHLNPSALRYYVLMGFLFGWLYWRLGLTGSISAHAAFNGVLVVFAFLALSGSTVVSGRGGVEATLPPGWHKVDDPVGGVVDLAAESPLGAGFVVIHFDTPRSPGAELNPFTQLPTPDKLPPGATGVQEAAVAGSPAVRFTMNVRGNDTTLVLVSRGSRRYTITLVPNHSDKARRQLDDVLSTLKLPAG